MSALTLDKEAVPLKAKMTCCRFQASRHLVSRLFSQNSSYFSKVGLNKLHPSLIVFWLPSTYTKAKKSKASRPCTASASRQEAFRDCIRPVKATHVLFCSVRKVWPFQAI